MTELSMIPADHLENTPVFHITHVDNLPSILKKGALLSTNSARGKTKTSIANEEIQTRRATRLVSLAPGGVLHDYVPFYFAPRAPMLYCNHLGSIQNARAQGEIIYFVTTAQILADNNGFVFYDRHAVLAHATCYNQLLDLQKIDWRIFFEHPTVSGYAKYWQDRYDTNKPHWSSRKEVRQAEFLVHESMHIDNIQKIVTQNSETAVRVNVALQAAASTLTVEVKPDWYF
ncbi:DUF4433 domain-containing protein [Persicirhabdus sediminis]|uniref:DUF4433 domain-containing protein n=2 Tax=Persicirhabdus sediminis TaxID=454144 RepID=A0A8J7MGK7_9BACT|nr:DUF4433 domain-containing protein [Persicirhabdus sediminis]